MVIYVIIPFFLSSSVLTVNTVHSEHNNEPMNLLINGAGYLYPYPPECTQLLDEFAESASNMTICSIQNSRPIQLCEKCINQYVIFHGKYAELLDKTVNGTTCKSLFISYDRLDAISEYHDNILSIWTKGHCNDCFNWTTGAPVLSKEFEHFNSLYNETITCIKKYINPSGNNSDEVCGKCMQSYLQLDNYYKTLSADSIGLDSVCMDIVDFMNATRSIWSKGLNCCKIRKSPEIVFLCCTVVISLLPFLYYILLRYCGPIRDLPNVLKQSRFKQTILRSLNRRVN